MSKVDLAKAVRHATGCTATEADAAVEAVLATIVDGAKGCGRFSVTGFGTFTRVERAARKGRNPKTGESIAIPPSSGIKFKPAPALKKSL
ncbi:MAG: HU family DNA-binding protein [Caulobacter sp.]|nr:HU family DNA-binding protein [Caulobacter sp.]